VNGIKHGIPILYPAMVLTDKIKHRSNPANIMKKTFCHGAEGVEFQSTTPGVGLVFWSPRTGVINPYTGGKLQASSVGLGALAAACDLFSAPPPPAPAPVDDDAIDFYSGMTSTHFPA
jgi:hypothetical protein